MAFWHWLQHLQQRLLDKSLHDLLHQLQTWLSSRADLNQMAAFNDLAGRVRQAFLVNFADWAAGCEQAEQINAVFDLTWF